MRKVESLGDGGVVTGRDLTSGSEDSSGWSGPDTPHGALGSEGMDRSLPPLSGPQGRPKVRCLCSWERLTSRGRGCQ